MVAFVIFWSAIFAVIFFVLGVVFKALAAALNAIREMGIPICIVGGVLLVSWLLISSIGMQGIGETLLVVAAVVAAPIVGYFEYIHDDDFYYDYEYDGLGLLGVLLFGIWLIQMILLLIGKAVAGLVIGLPKLFGWFGNLCDKAYGHFLKAITCRVER